MTFPDESDHVAAVLAKLTALGAVPYTLGAVPAPPPLWYTEVTVQRRYSGSLRLQGNPGTQGWRVTTRVVARKEDNARLLRKKAASIEGARLTIAGSTSTGVQFESSEDIGDDNGWWTGITLWTYSV